VTVFTVLIFRGKQSQPPSRVSNNTYVFYRLLQQALAGEPVGFHSALETQAEGSSRSSGLKPEKK
jgi:hypothetical protein